MYQRILVAIDSGQPAVRAVDAAIDLASQVHANLKILHVVDVTAAFAPEMGKVDQLALAELRKIGEKLLTQTISRLPRSQRVERMITEGEPVESILAAAREWGADMIVLGNDSRGRAAHFLLGSTADAVVRRASCPVMTVRADALIGTSRPVAKAAAI